MTLYSVWKLFWTLDEKVTSSMERMRSPGHSMSVCQVISSSSGEHGSPRQCARPLLGPGDSGCCGSLPRTSGQHLEPGSASQRKPLGAFVTLSHAVAIKQNKGTLTNEPFCGWKMRRLINSSPSHQPECLTLSRLKSQAQSMFMEVVTSAKCSVKSKRKWC